MPINIAADVRQPTDDEFCGLAYDVMACTFAVHNEIGRFCDEKIYKRLVAKRFGGIELEMPITVSFDNFQKQYFADMLVRNCALFEWKAVDRLSPEHRSQLLNYLLLSGLPKGKLINVRPELVEHEFVNTTLNLADRQSFRVDQECFRPLNEDDSTWQQFLIAALRDWGTGLDLHLYEAAIAHIFGGEEAVLSEITVVVGNNPIGQQRARITSSGASFKVTSIYENELFFEQHARRFLENTTLPAIHWVNVTRNCVQFKTLKKQEG